MTDAGPHRRRMTGAFVPAALLSLAVTVQAARERHCLWRIHSERQTREDFDTIETELDTIVTAWRKGDLATLEDTLLANFKAYPDLYKTLITQRNKAWMTTLEQLLEGDQTVMVVVGAGHLPGPDGLLEQLKKKGYAVEQR